MSSTKPAESAPNTSSSPEGLLASAEAVTPLMQQYQLLKARVPDALLLFRLGDFYEMFGDDAHTAAPILEVVLTQRQGIPMCGVPAHAVDGYLAKLIRAGFRVAIAEQQEDPALAKGLVKRDIVRVVTAGTLIEDTLLEGKRHNFLAALAPQAMPGDLGATRVGLAIADVSTGEFLIMEYLDEAQQHPLPAALARYDPRELLLPVTWTQKTAWLKGVLDRQRPITPVEDRQATASQAAARLTAYFHVASLWGFDIESRPAALTAAGMVLDYLQTTLHTGLPALQPPRFLASAETLQLDPTVIKHLELLESLDTGNRRGSLLEVLDRTLTPMGGRLFRGWLLAPLRHVPVIQRRLTLVELWHDRATLRRRVRELLHPLADLERVLARVSARIAAPREIAGLRQTLQATAALRGLLKEAAAAPAVDPAIPRQLAEQAEQLLDLSPLVAHLSHALVDQPPAHLTEGGIFRPGFHAELDELRAVAHQGKSWLASFEARERQRTGIPSLKVGYNSVFGYYLEVTKANLARVPTDYVRKQTLANAERFITPELKDHEAKVLGAEERMLRLETELFADLCERIQQERSQLLAVAQALASLDALTALAETAACYRYVKPTVDDSAALEIIEGRHPVVERALAAGTFVANDARLNGTDPQIILLTGPNMAGKSTYLRQAALIVILAQMGSFVPATAAHIGLVDQIFTRIGAADRLAQGESTFMVEMLETARILHQATARSLLILDEIGRGTSTFDGISIAWATVEYLHGLRAATGQGPKVLFATHYFELTALAETLPGVQNNNLAVREWTGPGGRRELVFLRKVQPGAADRSYGLHVAQLAGLPAAVILRAQQLLQELESASRQQQREDALRRTTPSQGPEQPELWEREHPLVTELAAVDVNRLTPLEALERLTVWKQRWSR